MGGARRAVASAQRREPRPREPWPLPNAATARALLGAPTALEVEEMRLEHGILRGTARDRVNGLLEPVMYARINGSGARGVAVEAPAPLPEGGCAFRFALALEPGDLNETGLSVALHLVGLQAPVARFAYARVGLEGPARPRWRSWRRGWRGWRPRRPPPRARWGRRCAA